MPIYQAECAPTKLRGSLVNTYQFFLLIGAVMAATANWGLYERTDQWAYRIVIILQFIIPGVMMVGGFILPESPRWLVRANRAPEALKVLQLLRRGKPEEEIEAEVRLLIAAEEEQRAVIASTTWVACLRYELRHIGSIAVPTLTIAEERISDEPRSPPASNVCRTPRATRSSPTTRSSFFRRSA